MVFTQRRVLWPGKGLLRARANTRPRFRIWLPALLSLFVWSFAVSAIAKKTPPQLHSVDLNTATEKQLEQLPGVGPTTAKAIVEFRNKAGRFRRVEDLLVIRGISESKLEKIRPYVIIGPPPKKPSQPPSS